MKKSTSKIILVIVIALSLGCTFYNTYTKIHLKGEQESTLEFKKTSESMVYGTKTITVVIDRFIKVVSDRY